jgi:hypothetical protein
MLISLSLFLFSCTATKTTVVIDCRGSYVTGGDGHGYLVGYEWKRNDAVLSRKPYDTVILEGSGTFTYTITLTDNLGQTKSESKKITVK